MIIVKKRLKATVASRLPFLIVLLITLFFGLKPKDYRIVNQVRPLEGRNGVAFTNIGMMFSERPLGDIGITDSMTLLLSLRPFSTGRRLSKIAAIIDRNGRELLAIEQWKAAIMVTLYDSTGCKMARTSCDMLSRDSAKQVVVTVTSKEIFCAIDDTGEKKEIISSTAGFSCFFKKGRVLLGLSAEGRTPWRGELYEVALFNRVVAEDTITRYRFSGDGNKRIALIQANTPASFFKFDNFRNRKITDVSGNGWNLCIPRVPKLFRYEILQPVSLPMVIDRSLIVDIIINFFGFIPFGIAGYLFFASYGFSAKKAFFLVVISSLFTTLFIETAQTLIPTRTSQLFDVVHNGAGAFAGAVGVIFAVKLQKPLSHAMLKP